MGARRPTCPTVRDAPGSSLGRRSWGAFGTAEKSVDRPRIRRSGARAMMERGEITSTDMCADRDLRNSRHGMLLGTANTVVASPR
jgi:hypothetical protein